MTKLNDSVELAEAPVITRGAPPRKERWPFSALQKGKYFEVSDFKDYDALRTAAHRAGKRYSRTFSVRKEQVRGRSVIRVYSL